MKQIYRFIDLFSGAGGFAEGFTLTGRFKSILGIDNFRPAALSYTANFPYSLYLMEDIKHVTIEDILSVIGRDSYDVVIGSPPCEPFTGANPRRRKNPIDRLYSDPMGQLTLHFIRIISGLKPRVFVMENVPAIMDDGLKNALIIEFKRAGYRRIYFNKLRAEDYDTPSHRLRVFISNVKINPKPYKHKLTVREVLEDLPPPGDFPPNHEPPPPLPLRKLKRASRLRWGEAMIYYEGAHGRRLPNLIRLDPDKIAPTVLGSSRFIHPWENRFLTVREQARLMGFPDQFVFYGGRDEQYNQVGEAVPVPLAKAIALFLIDKMDSGEV